jgi:putative transcriptional regulator
MDDSRYLKYRAWRVEAARLCRVAMEPPAAASLPYDVDVAAIRKRLGQVMGGQGISQAAFARRYGFSAAAVRDWEQHRRRPAVSARVLLLLIAHDPHRVDAVINEAINQAAADRERVDASDLDVEVVRPSSLPFEVQRLGRKRRGGVAA